MVASSEARGRRLVAGFCVAAALAAALWFFPLLRIVPLKSAGAGTTTPASAAPFDAAATAAKLWNSQLPAAAARAHDAAAVVTAIRDNPVAARARYGRSAGLGTAYYFVRGQGKIVSQDRNYVHVALDGAQPGAVVAVRVGPVFGNTVRDGCGLLDVNAFPGLHEFNALAAELNTLVEKEVLPVLRAKASVGATLIFAGCAEAPESVGAAGEPALHIVPVSVEIP